MIIDAASEAKRLEAWRGVGQHATKGVVVKALRDGAVVDADDEADRAAHVFDQAIPLTLAPHQIGDVAMRGVDVSLSELPAGVLLGEQLEAVEEEQVLRDTVEVNGGAPAGRVKAVAHALAAGERDGGEPVVCVPFKRGVLRAL